MKTTKLLALLLSVVFVAGCAAMKGGSDSNPSARRSVGEVIDDTTITAKVKTALLADADIKGLKIDVDTKDAVVRLKGEIKTLALRKKAEGIAKGVSGVKSVDNQLIISG